MRAIYECYKVLEKYRRVKRKLTILTKDNLINISDVTLFFFVK